MKTYFHYESLSPLLKQELSEKYHIDDLDIEDVFTSTQLSKVEKKENYLYVSLQFPQYEVEKRAFSLKEVHCFVSHKFFVTIDKQGYKYIRLFQDKYHSWIAANPNPFLIFYEMLDYFITEKFQAIGKFRTEIAGIESQIFDSRDPEGLLKDILIIRRNLITFTSIIYPLEDVIVELEKKYKNFVDEEGIEKLDDSLDKVKKIISNLKNYRDLSRVLFETSQNMINNSTNQTLKILTVLSVVTIPPIFLAGFFGMNIWFLTDLSAQSPWPIIFITAFMVVTTLAVYIWMKFKKLV